MRAHTGPGPSVLLEKQHSGPRIQVLQMAGKGVDISVPSDLLGGYVDAPAPQRLSPVETVVHALSTLFTAEYKAAILAATGTDYDRLLKTLVERQTAAVAEAEAQAFKAGYAKGFSDALALPSTVAMEIEDMNCSQPTQPSQPHSVGSTTSDAQVTFLRRLQPGPGWPSPRRMPSSWRASSALSLQIHSHCAGPPGHSSSHSGET
jgi:hypothetical protein